MKYALAFSGLVVGNLVLGIATLANESLSKSIAAHAPDLKSSEKSCETLELQWLAIDSDGSQMFHAICYRAPNQYAVCVSDQPGGVPAFAANTHALFVYDAIKTTISYMAYTAINVFVELTATNLNAFTRVSGESRGINSYQVNLQRIFDTSDNTREAKATQTAANQFRWERVSNRGNALAIYADMGKPYSVNSVDLFIPRSARKPTFTLRVAVNEPVDDARFVLPSKAELARHTPVVRWPTGGGPIDDKAVERTLRRAICARLAARDPRLRTTAERTLGLKNVDWEQVKSNDKKNSAVLKSLVCPIAIIEADGRRAPVQSARRIDSRPAAARTPSPGGRGS